MLSKPLMVNTLVQAPNENGLFSLKSRRFSFVVMPQSQNRVQKKNRGKRIGKNLLMGEIVLGGGGTFFLFEIESTPGVNPSLSYSLAEFCVRGVEAVGGGGDRRGLL